MAITLAQAQEKLDNAMDALDKAMEAESYSIGSGTGSRSQSRADVEALQRVVTYWENRVNRLTNNPSGGIRVRGVTPVG